MNVPGVQEKEKEGRVHMQQRQTAIEKLQQQLDMLTREANAVSAERSAMEIRACQKLLYKAMGILQAMEQLELLPKEDAALIKEDQERIQNKILNILYEKRKCLTSAATQVRRISNYST